jgi:enoyl-CoA hydratase/carnithine racemase
MPAREALSIGLISRVAEGSELENAVSSLVDDLRAKSGAVLRITVRGLRELSSRGFEEGLRRSENIYIEELLATTDVEEGVRAFLEKRKPSWRHR